MNTRSMNTGAGTAATTDTVHVHTQSNLGNANILCDPVRFASDIAETHVHRDVLRVMAKPSRKNPSLVIPSVHTSITNKDIFDVFRSLKLGHIDRIQFARNRHNDKPFVPVYIHFLYWYNNDDANRVLDKLFDTNEFKVKYDDAHPRRFWKVLLSDLSKPLPSISHEPSIKWHPRTEEEEKDLEADFDAGVTTNHESVEDKELCLVIPRVRKGYTAEHIRWTLRQLCIFKDDAEEDIEVSLFFPKKSSKGSAVAYMTAYVKVCMNEQDSASYFYNYMQDNNQVEVIHDVRPRSWSWILKKSDIQPPVRNPDGTTSPARTHTSNPDDDSNKTVISRAPQIEM